MHFHLIAINMQLSVSKHYIQFTLKYILLKYIISLVLCKSMLKCTFSQRYSPEIHSPLAKTC